MVGGPSAKGTGTDKRRLAVTKQTQAYSRGNVVDNVAVTVGSASGARNTEGNIV